MRCHICDNTLNEPRWNNEHESYEPCDPCLAVIQDTIDSFKDKPSADEDAFGSDPLPIEIQ